MRRWVPILLAVPLAAQISTYPSGGGYATNSAGVIGTTCN